MRKERLRHTALRSRISQRFAPRFSFKRVNFVLEPNLTISECQAEARDVSNVVSPEFQNTSGITRPSLARVRLLQESSRANCVCSARGPTAPPARPFFVQSPILKFGGKTSRFSACKKRPTSACILKLCLAQGSSACQRRLPQTFGEFRAAHDHFLADVKKLSPCERVSRRCSALVVHRPCTGQGQESYSWQQSPSGSSQVVVTIRLPLQAVAAQSLSATSGSTSLSKGALWSVPATGALRRRGPVRARRRALMLQTLSAPQNSTQKPRHIPSRHTSAGWASAWLAFPVSNLPFSSLQGVDAWSVPANECVRRLLC